MRRPKAVITRVARLGASALLLGASMLTASLIIGGETSPAFADTAPYELYCPGTPVGNIVLNDVVTTGTLSPANPSGTFFSIAGFQVQLNLPADVVSALQAIGATAIAGSYTTPLSGTLTGTPAGPYTFDLPIPASVPPSGLALDIPPSPASVPGGLEPPETIPPDDPTPPSSASISIGNPSFTFDLPGGPSTVTCNVFPDDTIATSGITTQTPTATTIAPVLAHATPGPPDVGAGPYYLALGDSVPMWNGISSYPYDIADNYFVGSTGPEVMDLACSGETTTSMLSGPTCAPEPYSSQMQEALAFLHQYGSGTSLITIDIGGNDVVNCVTSTGIDQQCVTGAVATMETNLTSILTQLRQAAPGVPIIGMNYFDPFLGDWLAGGAAQTEALATVPALSTLNSDLAQVYSQFNVPVADVFDAFQTSDTTDMVSSPWGTVPVAVDNACTWLDIVCTAGQLEGFGDDPVDSGAKVIAGTFEDLIGSSFPTPPTTSSTTSSSSPTSSTSSTSSTTTSTSTTTPTTTSTSAPTTSSTSIPTTSSTSTATTSASSTTTPGATTSYASSGSNGPVTAPSSALAFTGTSPAIRAMGVAGVASIVVGVALLLLVDTPRRLLRRVARVSRTRSRREGD
ncbi:MAG: SGNH/GDSL hydrolase family protein [Acidimicrobiales bacterium]